MYKADVSTWSPTVVFGYTPLGSGGMSYCNQTLFLSGRVGSGLETSDQSLFSVSQATPCEGCGLRDFLFFFLHPRTRAWERG